MANLVKHTNNKFAIKREILCTSGPETNPICLNSGPLISLLTRYINYSRRPQKPGILAWTHQIDGNDFPPEVQAWLRIYMLDTSWNYSTLEH